MITNFQNENIHRKCTVELTVWAIEHITETNKKVVHREKKAAFQE